MGHCRGGLRTVAGSWTRNLESHVVFPDRSFLQPGAVWWFHRVYDGGCFCRDCPEQKELPVSRGFGFWIPSITCIYEQGRLAWAWSLRSAGHIMGRENLHLDKQTPIYSATDLYIAYVLAGRSILDEERICSRTAAYLGYRSTCYNFASNLRSGARFAPWSLWRCPGGLFPEKDE